jgi:hypothetical protein
MCAQERVPGPVAIGQEIAASISTVSPSTSTWWAGVLGKILQLSKPECSPPLLEECNIASVDKELMNLHSHQLLSSSSLTFFH